MIVTMQRLIALTGLLIVMAACRSQPTPDSFSQSHDISLDTAPLPTAAVEPTLDNATPTEPPTIATPIPIPNTFAINPDDPLSGLRMDDLAGRPYGGSGIVLDGVVKAERYFTQYAMHYDSDGLRITGLIDIPVAAGPHPVIIVNHGYLTTEEYQSGFDSWRMADWMVAHNYITIMPDYRNYAGSDQGPNPFRIGYAVDIMNLIAQVDSLPQADPHQIGLLGHSMGGEINLWPMVISDEVDAVVLYASMSGDVARNWAHAWKYWPVQREAMRATALIYGDPGEDPERFAEVSPANFYDRVRMPVMIHHGTRDESVPYWWSEEMYQLMQDAGVDVTFWPSPGGTHGYVGSGFETMMQRNLEFFDENVRGDVNSPAD